MDDNFINAALISILPGSTHKKVPGFNTVDSKLTKKSSPMVYYHIIEEMYIACRNTILYIICLCRASVCMYKMYLNTCR